MRCLVLLVVFMSLLGAGFALAQVLDGTDDDPPAMGGGGGCVPSALQFNQACNSQYLGGVIL